MSDILDQAQELEEFQRDCAIQNVIGRYRAISYNHSKCCVDCGEDIPAQRRLLLPGVLRCICCQQSVEQMSRLWRADYSK